MRESFTDEEAETYLDSEKDNAFNKSAIKADAKSLADIEAETKVKLKKIVKLWDEQTKTNKKIKADKQALVDKTVDAIEHLTDEEISMFLHRKWIEPVCQGIAGTFTSVLSALESQVHSLSEKYAVSYQQIGKDMAAAQDELSSLVSQLTGDEYAIQGLKELTGRAGLQPAH